MSAPKHEELLQELKKLTDFSKALEKQTGDVNPTCTLVAHTLLIIRNFLRAMPDSDRFNLIDADVEKIWQVARQMENFKS